MHSAFTTCNKNTFKLQKEVKSVQKQPSHKKGVAYAKNDSTRKGLKIQGGSPEVAVMVGLFHNNNSGCLLQASLGIGTKITWIVVSKKISIILPSQPLLGHHVGFHSFFILSFFHRPHIFYGLVVFVYRYRNHEGLGFLAPKYHPKTSLIFTLWHWLGTIKPKNVFRPTINPSAKLIWNLNFFFI